MPTFLLLSPLGYLLQYKTGVQADIPHFLQLLAGLTSDARIIGFSSNFSIGYPKFYESHFSKPKDGVDAAMVSRYLMKQTDLGSEVNFNVLRVMEVAPGYEYYF